MIIYDHMSFSAEFIFRLANSLAAGNLLPLVDPSGGGDIVRYITPQYFEILAILTSIERIERIDQGEGSRMHIDSLEYRSGLVCRLAKVFHSRRSDSRICG